MAQTRRKRTAVQPLRRSVARATQILEVYPRVQGLPKYPGMMSQADAVKLGRVYDAMAASFRDNGLKLPAVEAIRCAAVTVLASTAAMIVLAGAHRRLQRLSPHIPSGSALQFPLSSCTSLRRNMCTDICMGSQGMSETTQASTLDCVQGVLWGFGRGPAPAATVHGLRCLPGAGGSAARGRTAGRGAGAGGPGGRGGAQHPGAAAAR